MKEKIIVLIIAIGVVFAMFPQIVFSPNTYMFSGNGDGLKNYFNAAYYVKYDSGMTFSGTQHPYGTHIVYTDNQPVISVVLMKLNHVCSIELGDYVVGIFNYVILLSIVAGIFMTYLILRFFKISLLFSLTCAVLITLMSPQIFRATSGHYALSYSFFIPAIWLMLLHLKNNSALFLFSMMAAFNVVMGFIHPYYILIAAVFQIAYVFVHFLYTKDKFSLYKNKYVAVFLSAGVSIVIFQLVLKLTDHVLDRPQSPWGLMEYRAVFEGIYLPVTGSLRDFILPYFDNSFVKLFFDLNYQSDESNAYVGVLGLAFLIFILIRIIYLIRIRRKNRIVNPVLPFELKVSIFCGLIVLLFSMAYPFRLGMEFLLELIPPLKQFRSLGRFAWVFYHIFLVFMCYYIFLLYKVLKRKNTTYAYMFIFCIVGIWSYDVYEFVQGNSFNKTENSLNRSVLDKYAESFNPKAYQCMATLPLYIAGTEKIDKDAPSHLKLAALRYSYIYHLPNISGELSRTSITYGQNIRQLTSDFFIHKEILKDLNKDSILLIVSPKELSKNEAEIVRYAQLIRKVNEDLILYRLSPSVFEKNRDSLIQAADATFNVTTEKENFVFNSFDSIKGVDNENVFYGEGALLLNKSNNRSYTLTLPDSMLNKTIEISFWVKLNYLTPSAAIFDYTLMDSQGTIHTEQAWLSNNEDISRGWILAKKQFLVSGNKTVVTIKSNIENSFIDELIIKEINNSVYTHTVNNKAALFNNYLLNK